MTKHLKEDKCNAGLSNQKKKEKQERIKEIKKNVMIWEFGTDIYTLLFKRDNQQGPIV